jgi:hypothetical protein
MSSLPQVCHNHFKLTCPVTALIVTWRIFPESVDSRGEVQLRLSTLFLIATVVVWGCSADKPRTASEAITLMTGYGKQQNHDKAIKTGEDWLKTHPEDTAHQGGCTNNWQSTIY